MAPASMASDRGRTVSVLAALFLVIAGSVLFHTHKKQAPSCGAGAACTSRTQQVACIAILACNTTHPLSVTPSAPNRNRFKFVKEWFDLHELLRKEAEEKSATVQIAFIGDSITEYYRGTDIARPLPNMVERQRVFKEHWGDTAVALGIGGDETQHLLWRLQNNELDGCNPRVVIQLIGTNNFGIGNMTIADTVSGILANAETVLKRKPDTKLVLMGLLPRARRSTYKVEIATVNKQLEKVASSHPSGRVFYLDCGPIYMLPNKTINAPLMPDFLHPSPAGMDEMYTHCVKPFLKTL